MRDSKAASSSIDYARSESEAHGPSGQSLAAAGSAALGRVLSDEPRYHVVMPGETLNSIAENVLHDLAAWLTLWHLNQHVVPDPGDLRVGTRLVLPSSKDLVQSGRALGGAPASGNNHPVVPSRAHDEHDDAGGSDSTSHAYALLKRHGSLILRRSAQLGIEPAVAAAIVLVESSGSGIRDGRTVIRFEPRVFRQLTQHVVHDSHANQAAEYAALACAIQINEDAAYRSISMGAGQIMGSNAKSLNYGNAKAMLTAFASDEAEQISAMLRFIGNNPAMVRAARAHHWTAFARIYNGPKQKGYDRKLARAFAAASAAANDTAHDGLSGGANEASEAALSS